MTPPTSKPPDHPRVATLPSVRRGSNVVDLSNTGPSDERRGPARLFVERSADSLGREDRHLSKNVTSGLRQRLDGILDSSVPHADFSSTAAAWLVKKAPELLLRRTAITVIDPASEFGRDFGETLVAFDYDKGIVRVRDDVRGKVIRVFRVPFVSFPKQPADPAEVHCLAEEGTLGFRHTVTKAMAGAMFREGKWSEIACMPVGTYPADPMADRYGQVIFGGSRAIKLPDGRIALFRSDFHANRFVSNADRLMMQHPSPDQIVTAYENLVRANREYVLPPDLGGLYLAPGLRPTGELLGVAPGTEYVFTCEAIPAGKIYTHPLKIIINDEFHRAARGGAGNTKMAGNYSPTFRVKHDAREKDFHDVLFLDSFNRGLAELTSSNVFCVVDMREGGKALLTPSFADGNILNGCTRDAILRIGAELVRDGVVDEVLEMSFDRTFLGRASEAFASGTGVTIQGIESIDDHCEQPGTTNRGYQFDVSHGGMGPVTAEIHRRFMSILRGEQMDHPVYGSWLKVVEM